MTGSRWLGLVLSLAAVLTGGCGGGAVQPPPSATVDNTLATECRFSIDGVEVAETETSVEVESKHDIAVKFRLTQPDPHPDGVTCYVRILGHNLDGVLVTYGHFIAIIKPDREDRVAVGQRLRIPAREGEYELQALILKGEERHLIGRHGLLVQQE